MFVFFFCFVFLRSTIFSSEAVSVLICLHKIGLEIFRGLGLATRWSYYVSSIYIAEFIVTLLFTNFFVWFIRNKKFVRLAIFCLFVCLFNIKDKLRKFSERLAVLSKQKSSVYKNFNVMYTLSLYMKQRMSLSVYCRVALVLKYLIQFAHDVCCQLKLRNQNRNSLNFLLVRKLILAKMLELFMYFIKRSIPFLWMKI